MIALKALAVWLLFVVLAIGNGTLREFVLVPWFGTSAALPLSAILLAIVIFIVTIWLLPVFGRLTPKYYWLIGAGWLVMTVAFEFLFGRFVAGDSWQHLFDAYNVASGNLWVFVLIVILVAPYAAAKMRGFVRRPIR